MKYTKEERLDIAKQVVKHELTIKNAAETYAVSIPTISNWIRLYKVANNIQINSRLTKYKDIDDLKQLSKEELIDEIIKARIGEERAKKGYEVKGGGQNKEFVSIYNKNTK